MAFWLQGGEASKAETETTEVIPKSGKQAIAAQYQGYEAQIAAMMPDFVQNQTSEANGVTTKTKTVSAVEGHGLQSHVKYGYSDGTVTAGAGREGFYTDDDGQGQRSGVQMSVAGSKDGGSARVDRVSGTPEGRITTGAEIGGGADGPTALIHRARQIVSGEKNHQTQSFVGGVKDGAVVLGKGNSSVLTQQEQGPLREGEERREQTDTANSNTSLVLGPKNLGLSTQQSETRENVDGSGTSQGSAMSFDVLAGTLAASMNKSITDAEGNTTGHSLAGDVAFTDGNVAANAEGAVQTGGLSLSLKGGISMTATPPKATASGKWGVAWKRTISGGGSMGGANAGLDVNAYGGSGGVEVFETQEDAQKYYEGKAWATASAKLDGQEGLEAIDAMDEGEALSEEEGGGAGAKGSASLGPVSVGAHVTSGSAHSFTVTKASKTEIIVEIDDSKMFGAGGSLESVGGGLSIGTSDREFTTQRLLFDVSTPAGRTAYLALRANKVVPSTGVRMLSNKRGTETTDSVSGSLVGIGATNVKSLLEEETFFEDGTKESRTKGKEAIGANFFGMRYNQSDALDVVDGADGKSSYVSTTEIDATSKAETEHGLAESADTYSKSRHKGGDANSGWSLQSTFSEGQIATIVDKCATGSFRTAGLGSRSSDAKDFVRSVRAAAGDKAKIRRALAVFVKEGGREGLKHLRAMAGGTYEHDLALAGDKYWLGAKGRIRLDTQLARLEEASQDDGQAQSEVLVLSGRILGEQHDRLAALLNSDRYSEVPAKIRQREVGRTRQAIVRLKAIAATAQTKTEAIQQEDANRGGERGEDGNVLMSPASQESSRGPEQSVDGLTDGQAAANGARTKLASLKRMRASASAVRARAHKYHWVLVEDALDGHADYYEDELASAVSVYEQANIRWEVATDGTGRLHKAMAMAAAAEGTASELQSKFEYLHGLVRDNLTAAELEFQMANAQFAMVEAIIKRSPWDLTRAGRTREMPEYRRE